MKGHVRQHGKGYVVVVDIGRDESGKRRQKWHSGYRTKKLAEAAMHELVGSVNKSAYVEPTRQTVAEFLREWLAGAKTTIRPSTWTSYDMNARCHIIPRLGATPLQGLTTASINRFYAQLLESGRSNGKGGLSPQTVKYVAMILKHALGEAVKWQRLVRNPADGAKPPKMQKGAEMKTWTAGELRAFLEHVQDDRLYAAYLVAATTGMRRGEVLGLRWRDIDLDAKRVTVRQALIAVGYTTSISPPKTQAGRRLVSIDDVTAAALRRHKARQAEEKMRFGPADWPDHDLAFTREDGSLVHPERLSRMFEAHARATNLPRIRLHDLRHTHATLALGAGVHPKVVSERLGHSSISITLDTYSHAIPAMQEEAAERVAAVVFGS